MNNKWLKVGYRVRWAYSDVIGTVEAIVGQTAHVQWDHGVLAMVPIDELLILSRK